MGDPEPPPYRPVMPSLHIEHAITDLATWTAAYGAFADVRRRSGVTSETVRHPVDDPGFVVIDLEFGTVEQAQDFLRFLETQVWASRERSPALGGTPAVRILEPVALTGLPPQPPGVPR